MFKIVLIIFLSIFSTIASAKSDQPMVIESVVSQEDLRVLIESVYSNSSKHKFLRKEIGKNGQSFRVVFAHKGNKYTVDHNWHTSGIKVWVRRSVDEKSPDVLGDSQMTGIVDYGSSQGEKFFQSEESVGSEYQLYWQQEYNQMLIGLKLALGK